MVQEAAEDVDFEKAKIKYFVVEKDSLSEVSDASVRMARHLSEIEQIKNFGELIKTIKRLRGKEGCPNDKAKIEETVAEHFIEESGEVKEAVRSKKIGDIKEEIGDILYNIFLFAEIKGEKGEFTVKDIADSAVKKMVKKHPGVFNDEQK